LTWIKRAPGFDWRHIRLILGRIVAKSTPFGLFLINFSSMGRVPRMAPELQFKRRISMPGDGPA
jgi:hypothetical protein